MLNRREMMGAAATSVVGAGSAEVSLASTRKDAVAKYEGRYPDLRVVTLEEHFSFPDLVARIDPARVAHRGFPTQAISSRPAADAKLPEFGELRFKAMDEAGIDIQVLSQNGPGSELMPGAEAAVWARETNDRLADIIKKNPTRYSGFAHLPLSIPEAAADELERAVTKLGLVGFMVHGSTDGLFLDDPRFEPVLARAEALKVPIYVHPGIPAQPVRDAYFGRLEAPLSVAVSRGGWGWHAEAALHVLRLVLSGALDRHPNLQIVIGHLGEGLASMFDRIDETFDPITPKYMKRTVIQTMIDQVHVTCSGFYHKPTFTMLLETFGIDRLMFSVDYPFSSTLKARQFLDTVYLSPTDREKFASGNADRLLKLKRPI